VDDSACPGPFVVEDHGSGGPEPVDDELVLRVLAHGEISQFDEGLGHSVLC